MTQLFKAVSTRLPAQNLGRARIWYAEMLGLNPVEERPGGLRYRIGEGEFSIYSSAGRSPATFTQLAITVDEIHAAVAFLRSRGVEILSYDQPPLATIDGIAKVEGNYPSRGTAELGCWFRDSEGNLLALGQSLP